MKHGRRSKIPTDYRGQMMDYFIQHGSPPAHASARYWVEVARDPHPSPAKTKCVAASWYCNRGNVN